MKKNRFLGKRFEWYETELEDEETGEIRELEPEDIEEELAVFGEAHHVDVKPEKIDLKEDEVSFSIHNKDSDEDLFVLVSGNRHGYYWCEVFAVNEDDVEVAQIASKRFNLSLDYGHLIEYAIELTFDFLAEKGLI